MSLEFNEISDVHSIIEASCRNNNIYVMTPCTTLSKCIMEDIGCSQCPYWKKRLTISPESHSKEQISQLILDMRDAALLIYTLES